MKAGYESVIAAKGIRPSVQRVIIYGYLKEHPVHPTADTVFSALSPDYPTLSRTTVYNTLKLLASVNLVQIIRIEDDELRYDANVADHLHFKCTCCGSVFDVFDDVYLLGFNAACKTLMPKGFVPQKLQTNIWGLCADCAKKSASAR